MWKCNWTTYAFQKFQTLTFAHFFSPLKLEKVFSPAFLPFLFVFLSTSVANATPAICKLVQKKVSRKSVSLNQTRSKLFKRGIKEKLQGKGDKNIFGPFTHTILPSASESESDKVQILWESHKVWRNLPFIFYIT